MIEIAVQRAPFSLDAALARLAATGAGAVASLTGIVRADDGVEELLLEHYPGMTEAALAALAEAARTRFELGGVMIVHRVGALVPGDPIVLAAAAAGHRQAALDGCAFLIDRLKTDAPFWKRERRGGVARWVEARAADDQAAARWR
jgi:molybdopterin synthase catalytic subunit